MKEREKYIPTVTNMKKLLFLPEVDDLIRAIEMKTQSTMYTTYHHTCMCVRTHTHIRTLNVAEQWTGNQSKRPLANVNEKWSKIQWSCTKQDKTSQDNTSQDKTRQDKTKRTRAVTRTSTDDPSPHSNRLNLAIQGWATQDIGCTMFIGYKMHNGVI